jgi:3-isopropylmalate/(R)-2-methylmalate dehydratase large subunit
MSQAPRTLHDKLWDQHRIATLDDGAELLHIDRIVFHEKSGSKALRSLAKVGRPVFDPRLAFGTMDHVLDTRPGRTEDTTLIPNGTQHIQVFRAEAAAAGLTLFDLGDPRQGITHVTMPQQGVVLPGATLVCGDSHTGTLGALGAMAWGVGVSEIEHALATQAVALLRPKTMRVTIRGDLADLVSAKDVILGLIGQVSNTGAVGHMVEYAGPTIQQMPIEGRMTLCNMAVEFGAWSAIIAPDALTFDYLKGLPFAPKGAAWDRAVEAWTQLRSDDDAIFDRDVTLDIDALGPQVSWGTNPGQVAFVGGVVPALVEGGDEVVRGAAEASLRYMGLTPGQRLEGLPIDAVFIGSCTNARLSDLRAAARVLRGRKIAPLQKAIVVPGSMEVKRQAEAEGLDRVFLDAGFEWREPGCSLCFFGGGEGLEPGARVASTTNRNFENRQGRGIRTHIMSPATAAASALAGALADPRKVFT